MSIGQLIPIVLLSSSVLASANNPEVRESRVYSKFLTTYGECMRFLYSCRKYALIRVNFNEKTDDFTFENEFSAHDCATRVRDIGLYEKELILVPDRPLSFKGAWNLWNHFAPWSVSHLAYLLPPSFNGTLYEANFHYIFVGFDRDPPAYTMDHIRTLNHWYDQFTAKEKVATGLQLSAQSIAKTTVDLRNLYSYGDPSNVIIKTNNLSYRVRNSVMRKLHKLPEKLVWFCNQCIEPLSVRSP